MRNNKNWIKKVISHQGTEAVPYNFMFSPPAQAGVEKYYQGGPLEVKFDFPIRMTAPASIKPLYADPAIYGQVIKDEFGVGWSTNKIDRGSPIQHCLTEACLLGYKFPDAGEAYRYEGLDKWCLENKEHYTAIWVGDLWERATFMRGMEDMLLDLYLNTEFVHRLLRGITDYIIETMKILFERYEFDAIAVSDDYGTQHSMIMSPDSWREFIKPYLTEIYAFAKDHGRTVFHHSCGFIQPIIGDMIDIGLDILHPIQPEAMDAIKLKHEFGRDLSFCGGINTQRLLPFGTVKEVKEEIRRLKVEMGAGGGYILEPGITIQADVPIKNIVAMIEEARNQDW